MISEVRPIWVVRAGRNAMYADLFLQQNLIAIGFGGLSSVAGLSWADVSTHAKSAMRDAPPVTQGLAAGALHRFAEQMREGDIVLTPEPGQTLLAGEIVGPYTFASTPLAEELRHTRRVRWFARVPKSVLAKEIRSSLGSLLTLFTPNYQVQLRGIVEPLWSSGTPPPRAGKAAVPPVQTAQVGRITIPEQPKDPPHELGAQFEADKRRIRFMLDQISNREIALPDFQRSFVWDPNATRELLISIIRGFPAGNLLFLHGGSRMFIPRAVEDAPPLGNHEPAALVLDGQQRLTSLFQALTGAGAHQFFVDIGALMQGKDFEDVVKAYSTPRAKAWAKREDQARALLFPLSMVWDYSTWRDDVRDIWDKEEPQSREKLKAYLNRVETSVINPIREYEFPLTTLARNTPSEAVCTIFETLNKTGIKLTVFELICSRAFKSGERLRQRWQDSKSQHAILNDFGVEPYYILQTIALRLKKPPQRGIVATLEVAEILKQWDPSVKGMAAALSMLRDECGVLTPKWLPYASMLPTLAAVWQEVENGHGPQVGARRLKLQRWFWCSSFLGDYDTSPNSQAEGDVSRLRTWLSGGEPPASVSAFQFDCARWFTITAHQRGLYRSTMALLMRHHPLDFHQAKPLTRELIESTGVDDHHVFPAAYQKDQGITGYADTVLNHTMIDKQTNSRIGKKAPSVYIAEMRREIGDQIDTILSSHGLPYETSGPLLQDDYDAFLQWRMNHLKSELAKATS